VRISSESFSLVIKTIDRATTENLPAPGLEEMPEKVKTYHQERRLHCCATQLVIMH
jgi:hypothetical protein